jgi:hypothetical protein
MRVQVDEPGRQDEAGNVDDATRRSGWQIRRDRRDPAAGDRDIRSPPFRTGPVDDVAAPQEQVVRVAQGNTRLSPGRSRIPSSVIQPVTRSPGVTSSHGACVRPETELIREPR